jgi:multidrug efflux pump subunit AcrB
MWLIRASIRNPFMVATLVLMILVVGVLCLVRIPVDILPVFKTPAVEVLTYYPGMPADSIEKTITNRVERWVNQAPGAELVESKSVPGVSIVKVYFRDDIDPNSALTLVNSLAQGALPTLPPNTLPPVVLPFDPTGTIPLGVLTVKNDSLDEARVKDIARIDVRNMLGSVRGCVAPVVVGGKDRTVLVYLDPSKLEARKLTMVDVVRALDSGNIMVTPGTAYFGMNQLLLDSNAMVKNTDDLNLLPIRTERGNSIFVRDVGQALDSSAIQTSRVRIEGRHQVYVPIYRQQGASSLAVANGVEEKVKEIEEQKVLPEGTELELIMDQTVYVREAIHSLVEEGIMGAVLVAIMILIFLGNWRMTLIATMSIPLAILGAIIGLQVTGNTINAMTLGGLALAIGPLVDDAIVELENNHRNYHLGKTRIRAALDGCAEVMVPVLVATCTTCLVLAPMALMPGMGGFLFRPLALTVAFAMFTSFILSRSFVPMMCAKFLPDEHRAAQGPEDHAAGAPMYGPSVHIEATNWFGRAHHKIDTFLTALTARYERLLRRAIKYGRWILLAIFLLFITSLGLALGIGREFFPQVDAGQITIYVRAPSNLRLDETEKRVIEIEDFLNEHIPARDRKMVVSEIGLDPDWSAAYTANSGQQDAVVRVQLEDERGKSSQEYAALLRTALETEPRFNDMRFSFDTGGMVSTALNFGASSPIDIEIHGGDPKDPQRDQKMHDLGKKIRNVVATVPGAADVRVLQRSDAPYLFIDIDRAKAQSVGLSTREVVLQVVAAVNSSVSIARNFWIDTQSSNQYFVAVQYAEDPNRKLEDVLNVAITGTNQPNPIKLNSLVTVHRQEGAVEVNHANLYKAVNVQVNTEGLDIASVAGAIQHRLKDIEAEAHQQNMQIKFRGEYERMNESFRNLLVGLALASVLVYLLQVALFRSWVGPFIIMFTVPLGLIGVLTMLFVTNTRLNVQSEMGVIFLVGIAVSNGVLLMDFAKKQRQHGMDAYEAIVTAATIRFRPILMTFLATFLDLIPMAIGLGRGSEANVPLARAVVGGLLTSTCLTLFVVPILYTMLMRKADTGDAAIEAELTPNLQGAES